MVKFIVVLINMVGVILANIFFPSDVTLQLRAPTEVTAGAEFDIEVILRKPASESF